MSLIKTTANYDLFVVPEYNRPVYGPFVNRIKKSMKINGFLDGFPIAVIKRADGRFDVTDGQHRFRAARELGIGIKYILSDTIIDPSTVPGSRKWSRSDFINRFAKQGIEEYEEILDFARQYGLSISVAMKMLISDVSNNRVEQIESGKIVITHRAVSQIAASAAREAQRLNSNLLINPLALTIYTASRIDDLVSFNEIARRVEMNASQMIRFNSMDRGYGEIEKAFNFKLAHEKRRPLEMLIRQRSMELKKTFGKRQSTE